jgi:hypothetical protein
MLQRGGHVDLLNSIALLSRLNCALILELGIKALAPGCKASETRRKDCVYTEVRMPHVSQLKIKMKRYYKMFKSSRNQEKKFILLNILQTAFTFVLSIYLSIYLLVSVLLPLGG